MEAGFGAAIKMLLRGYVVDKKKNKGYTIDAKGAASRSAPLRLVKR